MVSGPIVRGLGDAGLARFTDNFMRLPDASFLSLMMSDYATYGVVDLEDKQKLFRLIKQLSAAKPTSANGVASSEPAPVLQAVAVAADKASAGLLDLEDPDGDLLGEVGAANAAGGGGREGPRLLRDVACMHGLAGWVCAERHAAAAPSRCACRGEWPSSFHPCRNTRPTAQPRCRARTTPPRFAWSCGSARSAERWGLVRHGQPGCQAAGANTP